MTQETYLGDGLFASIDGGMITLRAPRAEGDHWVSLDAEVLTNFLLFCEQQHPGFFDKAAKVVAKKLTPL